MKAAASPTLRQRWDVLSSRERTLLMVGGGAVLFLLLWFLAIQPVIDTWRKVPGASAEAELESLLMQRLATEAAELKGQAPVSTAQATQALQAATDRLSGKGTLVVQGDRATLTLKDASPEQLRAWLDEARQGARARPMEMQINRSGVGLSGTLVLALPGAP